MDDADLEAILAEYDGAEGAEDDIRLSPLLSPVVHTAPVSTAVSKPVSLAPTDIPRVSLSSVPVAVPPTLDPRLIQLSETMNHRREEAIIAPILNAALPRATAAAAPVPPSLTNLNDPALFSNDDFLSPSKGHRTMTGVLQPSLALWHIVL